MALVRGINVGGRNKVPMANLMQAVEELGHADVGTFIQTGNVLFSAAGRVPPAGPSLAAVFTIGYLGFILGPPVIGVLADALTLTAALALVCAALVLVALLGGRAVGETRADSRSVTYTSSPRRPTG